MNYRMNVRAAAMAGALLLLPCGGFAFADAPPSFEPAQIEFFESKVRPLLAMKCWGCHGEKKQESGLRLDSRAAALAGGDSGDEAVVAGDPGRGLLIAAVRRSGDYEMPPDESEQLSEDEIATLSAWIKMGLPWPAGDAPQMLSMNERLARDRAEHWAFQPVRIPPLPQVAADSPAGGWARRPLDRFILAKLEQSSLSPSNEADRRTLIRRVSLDLVGLPPTPAEVAAFVADDAPDAYERLVDRLLASPRFGERWGRHWLDVARYADTRGYAFARERRFPYAYTYRDYVIAAFNGDLPYDRFLVEQLAADRLEGAEPASLAALGFLTVGRRYNNDHDDIDDRIDATCRGLMGLTVACARCHDHKYDAIPAEDYYSLYGVFASMEEPAELPLLGDPAETAGYEQFQAELKAKRQTLDDFLAARHAELLEASRSRVTDYLVRVVSNKPETLLAKLPFLSLGREDLKPKLVERWRRYLREQAAGEHAVFGPFNELARLSDEEFSSRLPEALSRWREAPPDRLSPLIKTALLENPPQSESDLARIYGRLLEEAYAAWKDAGGDDAALGKLPPEQQPLAHLLLDEGTPTAIPKDDLREYLVREDRNKLGELQKSVDAHQANAPGAPPRAMSVVDKGRPYDPRVFIRGNHARPGDRVPRRFVAVLSEDHRPFADGGGRLDLAQAIASRENPLTARVIVNRVWMHHFGEPLVVTPSDFGIRSEPPSHPELLDYLAWELVEHGWSLKWLHRELVLSAAYRQTCQDRPDCRAADPENRLLWRMNRRRLELEPLRDSLLFVAGRLDTAMEGRPVDLYATEPSRRRSIYGLIDRQDLPNLLRVFNFAGPDHSSPRRPETIVPQQALYLMNSPFVIEQAKSLAARAEGGGDEERVASLYSVVFQRAPTDAEQEIAARLLADASPAAGNDLSPFERLAQLLLMTNEFAYID